MMQIPTSGTTTAWLIRHGESAANAGLPVADFSQIPLTALGHEQAQILAARFHEISPEPPTRIIQSPYLRARQTAEPLIRRYPQVPVETWPVFEFTYLDPIASAGLNETQRGPLYARYWKHDDPEFREKNGAESFSDFLNRVRDLFARLERLPAGERVAVFCHGYLMQAVRLLLLFPERPDRSMMSESRILNDTEPIANTEILELRIQGGRTELLGQGHITPLTLEGVISHE
jgi:probable phosphoglycerate mutase